MSAAELLEQIRRLPPAEQGDIAHKILMELKDGNDDLTPEQIAELDRRAEEFAKNPQAGVTWDQLRDEARNRFGSH